MTDRIDRTTRQDVYALIDRRFDGTIMPLTIAYVAGTAIAIAGWRWAVVATREPDPAIA